MEDLSPRPGDLEPIETASRDEITALQLERMRWSLGHAYDNSPFYRKRFDEAGVHPSDLKDVEGSRQIPLHPEDRICATTIPSPCSPCRWIRSAASMPRPAPQANPPSSATRRHDLDVWANVVARSIRASGGRPGDIVHCAYGYGLFTGGLGAHYGAEKLGCTVIPVSGGMTERQVTLITDFKPRIIMVTPSYMLSILDEFRRQGVDPRESSLAVGIFGAEPWTNAVRDEIERAFDMHAVDIYGLSEIMGPGVANECVETKDGLHVWEDHFYPEIIDPETGEVLADGEYGELVFTSLTKAGPADHALSHPGSHAHPAGHGAVHAAYRKDHRPLRRHDHPARRQCVPDAGRGADPEMRRPVAAFPDRAGALRPHGRHDRPCRGRRGGGRRGGAPGFGARTRPSHQERHRHHARRSMSANPAPSSARSARQGAWSTTGRRGSRQMARTRANDYEDKQRSILESAAAVFADLGMDKASMSLIARQCDISKPLLYHYYESKDALIFDIVRTHLTELDEALALADRPAEAPEERLRILIHEVLENYRDADNPHKVQLNIAGTLPDELTAEIQAIERRIVRRFSSILDEINPRLNADKSLLMPATMSLFGMLNWVYLWFRDDGPISRDDYAEMATKLFLGGIRTLA